MSKRVNIDVYVVISESVFLVLEPEPKMKGIGKLVSWGTLPTIDNIKRNHPCLIFCCLVAGFHREYSSSLDQPYLDKA